MSLNKRILGSEKESTACRYLENNGYTILERNYRNKLGEIDIIAKKDNILTFIEVKYRSSDKYGSPLEAVDVRKQRHIGMTALFYSSSYKQFKDFTVSFDVIGIHGDGTIEHVKNAFEFQGVSSL